MMRQLNINHGSEMLHTLSLATLPTLMIIAALIDVSSLRIPNWLTGLTALLFFPMALLTGMPLGEFGWHLLAGASLFFAGYALFSFGLFGGGDAKLMAAAGLWFGTSQTMSFLILTALAGGLLAVAYGFWAIFVLLLDYHGTEKTDGTAAGFIKSIKAITPKLPYGFALAVGAILAFPQTWWMQGTLV